MNPEHLQLIKSSIDEWNKWRSENWQVKPDLSGADLRGVNLFKANLDDTNFASADLRDAILINCTARHADFEHANLEGTKLQGANLTSANLTRASLRESNVMGAIFKGACLMECDLSSSDCTGAKFENSNLLDANIYDAIVKGANFEGSNIHEANLYADQFKEANIPLESVGEVDRKQKTGIQYAWFFLLGAFLFIVGFGAYIYIFQAEEPGAKNTLMRGKFYFEYGKFLDGGGNRDGALEYYKLATRFIPKEAEVYYHIGGVYRLKAKEEKKPDKKKVYRDKAVWAYAKYKKMAPRSKQVVGIEQYLYQHESSAKKYKDHQVLDAPD